MRDRWLSELEKLELYDTSGIQHKVTEQIMQICDVLIEQGHTEFSIQYLFGLMNNLVKNLPLTPLTGEESEWDGYQNKRCPFVFRDDKGVYNLRAYVFSEDGKTFFTAPESKKYITFPISAKDLKSKYMLLAYNIQSMPIKEQIAHKMVKEIT